MKKMTRCIVILLAFTAISAISISCTRTDFPDDAGTQGASGYEFKRFQQIPTSGAYDWEHFSIDGVGDFLIVANESNNSTYDINSVLYLWNGYTFEVYQTIPTNGALDCEHFIIDGVHYLAVANYISTAANTRNIPSRIYKWDGKQFKSYQDIPTNGALTWKFFSIDNVYYLIVANYCNDSIYNISSTLYSWNASSFTPVQSIQTHGAFDWEYFEINGEKYIAVANYHDDSTHNATDSCIYKWDKYSSLFNTTPVQNIPTTGAMDLEYFSVGNDHYLAIANYYNGSSGKLYSKLYQWNGSNFSLVRPDILTYAASGWEYFSMNGDNFLAVANEYNDDTSSYKTQSVIYKWDNNTKELTPWQNLDTNGASALHYFTIGSRQFLAVANYYEGGNNFNLNSTIYILDKK